MSTTPEVKLNPMISVIVDGQEREVFMSFALLNRLAYLVGNPEQVGIMMLDPVVRETALTELLAERTKGGKVINQKALDEYEVSLEEVEKLLDWAAEHVLNFTIRVAEKSTAHATKHQDRLLSLTSTAIGLANSVSKKSAA